MNFLQLKVHLFRNRYLINFFYCSQLFSFFIIKEFFLIKESIFDTKISIYFKDGDFLKSWDFFIKSLLNCVIF
jgi:hypothetical protein